MDNIINTISQYIDISMIWYIILYPFMIFWIWSILYTTKDISHRTESIFYQILCILIVTLWTPLIWFPLYFILRPSRKLDDISWRKILENIWKECPECWDINHKDNRFCKTCWEKIDIKCKECKKEYSILYEYCPYCWAPNIEDK